MTGFSSGFDKTVDCGTASSVYGMGLTCREMACIVEVGLE